MNRAKSRAKVEAKGGRSTRTVQEGGWGVTSAGPESFRGGEIYRVIWPYLFIMPGPRRGYLGNRLRAAAGCQLSHA
jgi:hypothetical protein